MHGSIRLHRDLRLQTFPGHAFQDYFSRSRMEAANSEKCEESLHG